MAASLHYPCAGTQACTILLYNGVGVRTPTVALDTHHRARARRHRSRKKMPSSKETPQSPMEGRDQRLAAGSPFDTGQRSREAHRVEEAANFTVTAYTKFKRPYPEIRAL
jgi:hypothetical protein